LTTHPATSRPMIWVTPSDREPILNKIESHPWAAASFDAMKNRVADAVQQHQVNPDTFLRGLPLLENTADSSAHPTLTQIHRNMASVSPEERSRTLQRFLAIGVDCGVLYFLTLDATYARCAADILHATVEAMVQMEPGESTNNGGLVYPNDHLYEARVVGAQLPLIYDFIAEYLKQGSTVHSLVVKGQCAFDFDNAQAVFRLYARLAIEHGIIDCNWPVLEMASLTHNVLALEDPAERSRLLEYVTHKDTPHQDSLKKVVAQFDRPGAIWPESFQYSGGVAELTTYIVALLLRQDPPVTLPDHFVRIPLSLARLHEFRFPNGDNICFGDGPRRSREDFRSYEVAYSIGLREANTELQQTFGARINLGFEQGKYERSARDAYHLSAHPYFEPLQLLWFESEVSGQMSAPPIRTTDELPFVGAVLQRNLSPDQNPSHGLMAAVHGGHHVHGHASGMALELYGCGEVLGACAGKGTYKTDEHENYRRIFAAYNNVIVNGASRSAGGWVNLEIDTVEKIALEPAAGARPVSSNHSFSVTGFNDERGPGAKARQERLVGIVRTSAKTGYYVDVFRSRSSLPDQFHDYLYHNIGDDLFIQSKDGELPLTDSPDRFVPAEGSEWSQNKSYLFPGWHVFERARVSQPFAEDLQVDFCAAKLDARMRLYIPGASGREYASAHAPQTKAAPEPYDKESTPVLVMRQTGEAWDRPFAVIYEPFAGSEDSGSIKSVSAFKNVSSDFNGFKVVSDVGGHLTTQYILVNPSPEGVFDDEALGVRFHGRYGVVSLNEDGVCTALYLGEGSELRFGPLVLTSVSGSPIAASVDLNQAAPTLTATASAELRLTDGKIVSSEVIRRN
jgi:hypothetical protein